jgi:hypothetical protein
VEGAAEVKAGVWEFSFSLKSRGPFTAPGE